MLMLETLTYTAKEMKARVLEETKTSLSGLKQEVVDDQPKENLRKLPISLWYKEIYKERVVSINLPDEYSVQWRILRCLRWKAATDAAEHKYGIPHWLLLAMMAQEWMWDPTQPNDSGHGRSDGGLGLIHIQAQNAAEFGLHTLPRSTTNMQDFAHGEKIKQALKDNKYDITKLIKTDDRFHPIMSIDCAARFLKDNYNKTSDGPDRWINALRKYSWRAMNDYLWPVVKYRKIVSTYTGVKLPVFSDNTNKELKKMDTAKFVELSGKNVPLDIIQQSIKKLSITIDGVPCTYAQYLLYHEWQLVNYWLKEYIAAKPKYFPSAEGIQNLEFLRVDKDKQQNVWDIYKYTLPQLDKVFTDLNEFLHAAKLHDKFGGKNIEFTDEKWSPYSLPSLSLKKPGEPVFIKEKE